MKQSLQLKMGQSLTMTPQLQQAIRLLQLSTLDLQQEIQAIIETNPMLEINDDNGPNDKLSSETDGSMEANSENQPDTPNNAELSSSETLDNNPAEYNLDNTNSNDPSNTPNTDHTASDDGNNDWQENIPNELPVDTKWDDIYTSMPAPSSQASQHEFNDSPEFENKDRSSESLKSYLEWQLNLTPMTDKDQYIAATLLDDLAPCGMLSSSIEELHESFDPELDIEIDEIEAVRHRIQQFDPLGVASTDLTDCLMVQLAHLPANTPWREQAAQIINRHITLLASRDFSQLMRRTRLKENELSEVIGLIRSLNPKPGDAYQDNAAEYIVPDVYVKKNNGKWVVELNPDIAPKIKINTHYASMIKRADNSSDNTFLRDNLQEAKWFLKSLHSRNDTLLKVATRIVEHQRDFLEHGEEAMKPLILHSIAQDVEMHESTVSRVTTKKYMHTPRGIFELKYFFSSHVSTTEGGECSSTAIRAIIKKLVAAEQSKKPLSDNKIAQLLGEKGIKVARRTVAKYRESMMIPPSNERKRLA